MGTVIETLNGWVTTAASWITVITATAAAIKWLAPRIRESLKQWRTTRKR